jgi:hypothetical protein
MLRHERQPQQLYQQSGNNERKPLSRARKQHKRGKREDPTGDEEQVAYKTQGRSPRSASEMY